MAQFDFTNIIKNIVNGDKNKQKKKPTVFVAAQEKKSKQQPKQTAKTTSKSAQQSQPSKPKTTQDRWVGLKDTKPKITFGTNKDAKSDKSNKPFDFSERVLQNQKKAEAWQSKIKKSVFAAEMSKDAKNKTTAFRLFEKSNQEPKSPWEQQIFNDKLKKSQDTYSALEKGRQSNDNLIFKDADFLKEIESDIYTHMFDKEVGERDRKIVEDRVKEKTARGEKTTFKKEWADFVRQSNYGKTNAELISEKKTATLSGDFLKPAMYMSQDEIDTYNYMLGKFGKDAANDYYNSIKPKIIENAKKYNVSSAYEKLGRENKWKMLSGPMLTLANESVTEGISNSIKKSVAKSKGMELSDVSDIDDFDGGVGAQRVMQGAVSASSNWFEKQALSIFYGLEKNATEEAMSMLPYMKPLAALYGGFENAGEKYAEQYLNGTLDAKGSDASLIASFVLGALPVGKIGNVVGGTVTKAILKGATRSGIIEAVANLAGNALGGAVTGLSFYGIEEASDRFFMGENSPYEINVKNYINNGMSERSAREKATQDTFNNMFSVAVVGSLQSLIHSIPQARSWGVDFKKRGEKISSEDGGLKRLLDEAESASPTSECYLNAERIRQRINKGKPVYDDMLGAQDYLNSIEKNRQRAFAAGMTDITGIRIGRGKTDDGVNATYKDGSITVSVNPDSDAIEVIKHEVAHGVEASNKYGFDVIKQRLRNAPGYENAVERMKTRYDDAGIPYNDATIESEVAAEFARNFVKTSDDVERLKRAVNGNPALFDRIYTGVRDMRMKLKAKRGDTFEDPITGIRLDYDELATLEKMYEGMLTSVNERYLNSDSHMHSVKENNDVRAFGMSIHNELNAFSRRKMSKAWKDNKSEVKELIRQAYRSYKTGDIKSGDNALTAAGGIWSASLSKGGTKADTSDFAAYFKKLYNDNLELNTELSREKQRYIDIKEFNIGVSGYTKRLMKDIGVSGARRNEAEETTIREAFTVLNSDNEPAAREILTPMITDLLTEAKMGYSSRDKELLSRIAGAKLALTRDAEGGENLTRLQRISRASFGDRKNNVGVEMFLDETKSLFPEYPWRSSDETLESPADEIIRVYDTVRNNATKPRYSRTEIAGIANDIIDTVVKDFYNARPASKETPDAVRSADISAYGVDIESGFRSIGVSGIKEVDVKELSNNVREIVSSCINAIKEQASSDTFVKSIVDRISPQAEQMFNTVSENLLRRGYSSEDANTLSSEMYSQMIDILDKTMNSYKLEISDSLSNKLCQDAAYPKEKAKSRMPNSSKDVDKMKAEIKNLDDAQYELSRVFSNTMQKDFFENASKESSKRVEEFVYKSVTNKDTANAAIEYLNKHGTDKVFRELVENQTRITAFDTAKAWALAGEYRRLSEQPDISPAEKSKYTAMMVDVMSVMRDKWTKSGQAIQAMRLFNMLTLEGQLLELKRQSDSAIDKQMRNRPDYEDFKRDERVAKRKDAVRKSKEKSDDAEGKTEAKSQDAVSELEKVYKKYNVNFISEKKFEYMKDILRRIDEASTAKSLDDVIDIIMSNSKLRKTNASKSVRKRLYAFHESETKLANGDSQPSFEVLVNTARAQVFAMVDDAMPKTLRRKVSTIQSIAMLDNFTTSLRNIISNFALSPAETIVHDIAVIPDYLMSLVTHRRTLGLELPAGYISGGRRSRKAALEQNLRVNTFIDSENGYTGKNNRTFANNKFMTKVEELTGYNLTVTDEFQKGVVEKNVERSLKRLIESGYMTADEAADIVANEMKYRTFQDETYLGNLMDSIKKGLNFRQDFGLGDFVIKFTKVPGAVITRNLEYSPVGYLKFALTVAKTGIVLKKQGRKMSASEQREIALTLARPTSSLGLIASGAFLRQRGIIVGSDTEQDEKDEENYLKKKLHDATGIKGFKLNISALERYLKGEDASIKDGDLLSDLSWAPFAAQLSIGAALHTETGSDADTIVDNLCTGAKSLVQPDKSVDYAMEQLSDLPAMQGVRDIISNWEYKTGYIDFAAQTASDAVLSFVPSLAKRLGYVTDDKSRDPYHADGTWERALQKVESQLPIKPLRDKVPQKINSLGQPVSSTLGSVWADILNEMINPGRINRYSASPVTDELDTLLKYNKNAMPKIPYKTGNVVEIDDIPVSFNLYGKDYEEYSKLLGTQTVKNISDFMASEYYKYLPRYQRADAVELIAKKTETACKLSWAEMLLGTDEKEYSSIIEKDAERYPDMAKQLVLINQATDYVQKDGVKVEDVVNCYIERPYTEEEKNKYIADKKRGKYTEREKELVANVLSGKSKYREYIKGEWKDLSEKQREKVVEYIKKYPDKITVQNGFMDFENLIDYSEREETPTPIIDITGGYDRSKLTESPLVVNDSVQVPDAGKKTSSSKTKNISRSGGKSTAQKRSGGSSGVRGTSPTTSEGVLYGLDFDLDYNNKDEQEFDKLINNTSPFKFPRFQSPESFGQTPKFVIPFKGFNDK